MFSPLGVLLNIADMSVDSKGKVVGFATRLEDVAERYGKDSVQYRDCLAVINAIESTSEWSVLNEH